MPELTYSQCATLDEIKQNVRAADAINKSLERFRRDGEAMRSYAFATSAVAEVERTLDSVLAGLVRSYDR